MTGLPGGAPSHPHYTPRSMALILLVTLLGTAALLLGYRVLVAEGDKVAKGIEEQASPLWDPSQPIE